MASIDSVSITILFGAVLVLAGIMSSLIALRFGAPLLLVFLLVGMLAGESGIGGIKFDDVRLAYTVGSVALGLILFDGGLRTRLATFRNVLAPAGLLATVGVLITAALTAPMAVFALGLTWTEGFLVGAMVASTDAAAVFFLIHAKGLRLRPRVSATLEVESATNDPFAIFLTIVLVEILLVGSKPWSEIAALLLRGGVARRRSSAGPAAAPSCWCSIAWTCRKGCTRRSSPPARWWCSAWRRSRTARVSSRSMSPASWSATARRARTRRWCRSSMPRPGWRRSRCSCCSACSPGPNGCRSGCCRR